MRQEMRSVTPETGNNGTGSRIILPGADPKEATHRPGVSRDVSRPEDPDGAAAAGWTASGRRPSTRSMPRTCGGSSWPWCRDSGPGRRHSASDVHAVAGGQPGGPDRVDAGLAVPGRSERGSSGPAQADGRRRGQHRLADMMPTPSMETPEIDLIRVETRIQGPGGPGRAARHRATGRDGPDPRGQHICRDRPDRGVAPGDGPLAHAAGTGAAPTCP